MLFPQEIISTIRECADWADRLTRADLADGVIVTENDYTSNLTAALRREINARNISGLKARVQVLRPSAERALGADACIIFSNSKEFKAGIFEAKWPRLSTNTNSWDSLQKSSGRSHFDEQIRRQRHASKHIAVWEMFYSEHPFGEQPQYMPDEGSACVWHDIAYDASTARANKVSPWTDTELELLLKGNSITIADVLGEICECKRGSPMPDRNYAETLRDFGIPEKALVISYPSKDAYAQQR